MWKSSCSLLFGNPPVLPLGAVIGCDGVWRHTQQHCLQTPGRDDVTLQKHMFFRYARSSPRARSRFYRTGLCLAFKRQSACCSREGSPSRSERVNKRVSLHDLHTLETHADGAEDYGGICDCWRERRKTRSGVQWDFTLGLLRFLNQ